MKITLKYFASVREAVGLGQEAIELPGESLTVGEVRATLVARGGAWADALGPQQALRMAHKQVMCGPGQEVEDGAEVAFFPPVTGG